MDLGARAVTFNPASPCHFMRIAVDVMGGDHGPSVVIDGVLQAMRELSSIDELTLVGNEDEIKSELAHDSHLDPRLKIPNASEVLTMEDKPIVGLRKKKDCSILKAIELLKQGQAQAVISLGNTGGVVAASTLRLRPLPGIDRPGIATVMPAPQNEFILLDAGANIDCRPIHLAHYAIMGSVYAREILGLSKPRVGLLSVGTEEIKGNDLTREALQLCRRMEIHFIGNVEGHDLFANRVDVVVCDGFVGNVVLKTCESLAVNVFEWVKRELTQSFVGMAGAFLARKTFSKIKRRMDPDNYGCAPLLGLNGLVMIAHGSARARAIKNAVRVTMEALQHHVQESITVEVSKANRHLTESSVKSDSVPLTV